MPDHFGSEPTGEFRLGARLSEIVSELDQSNSKLQGEFLDNLGFPVGQVGHERQLAAVAVTTLHQLLLMLLDDADLDRRSLAAAAVDSWDSLSTAFGQIQELKGRVVGR